MEKYIAPENCQALDPKRVNQTILGLSEAWQQAIGYGTTEGGDKVGKSHDSRDLHVRQYERTLQRGPESEPCVWPDDRCF